MQLDKFIWLIVTVAFVISAKGEVLITHLTQGKIKIEINGELFTEYVYQDYSRPFLYPILGPGQLLLSRNWPLKEVEGEEQDHPHHKSLWWAHGDINGIDFWTESPRSGKIVHEKILQLCSGQIGIIKTRNRLIGPTGNKIGTVDFEIKVYSEHDVRVMDFNVTVYAAEGKLTFGDTKEGTMAIRVAETMRLKPNRFNQGKPTGHIVNSEGLRDGDCWGKRAKWVDYYGPVGDKIMGVAIFDHPSNPRHPTWWHVRDYGLFAANPFGIHDFEKKPAGTGDLTLKEGESITFRYRFIFHEGDEKVGRIAERYELYTKTALDK